MNEQANFTAQMFYINIGCPFFLIKTNLIRVKFGFAVSLRPSAIFMTSLIFVRD